jgi:hypothetical protein
MATQVIRYIAGAAFMLVCAPNVSFERIQKFFHKDAQI